MTLQYDIEKYEEIKNEGFSIELPEYTINIVNQLAEQVGAPTYNKTPVFENREYKKKKNNLQLTSDDWEAFRNFKATEIATSSGINKYFDDVRFALNKMTETTYVSVKDEIIQILRKMMDENYDNDAYSNVGKSIFDMASSNKFYSDIYAKLYSDIMQEFEMFKGIFDDNLKQFMTLFKDIQSAGDDADYNKLCEVNKQNDNRRALSLFFVNLMNYGVISEDNIIDIVDELQNNIISCSNKEGETDSVQELTENMFIIISHVKDKLNDHVVWPTIVNRIVSITELSAKERPSINNKIIFKHMDLLDILEP